jgi:hypothetical protein
MRITVARITISIALLLALMLIGTIIGARAQEVASPLPPLGWVYGPYTSCADPPQCSTGMVTVQADGLNVRTAPDGFPVMALVNGTPFIPLQRDGNWFLIAPACDLTPTWAWSWTANVPLNRCWVY